MIDFRRILLIARREWLSRVRERTFRISTIVQLVLTLLAACLPTIIARFENNDSTERVTIGVINSASVDLATQFDPYFAVTEENSTRYTIEPLDIPASAAGLPGTTPSTPSGDSKSKWRITASRMSAS